MHSQDKKKLSGQVLSTSTGLVQKSCSPEAQSHQRLRSLLFWWSLVCWNRSHQAGFLRYILFLTNFIYTISSILWYFHVIFLWRYWFDISCPFESNLPKSCNLHSQVVVMPCSSSIEWRMQRWSMWDSRHHQHNIFLWGDSIIFYFDPFWRFSG